jgi:hypothetical protein
MSYGSTQPARVETALQTLHFLEQHAGCERTARVLSRQEEALRRTALTVLHLYLTGEMDYADAPEKGAQESTEPEG